MTPFSIEDLVTSLHIGSILPQDYAEYRPLLADGICFFLERLPEARLRAIIREQLTLDAGTGFADRVLSLLHQCPTLHKLGQIIARDRRLSLTLRQRLQSLESVPPKTRFDEIPADIVRQLRAIRGIEIIDRPLAEASVAMILPFSWHEPGDSHKERREGVFKLLKPGVEERLHEELEIWNQLGAYLEERCDYHGLPMLDYKETLQSVGQLLRKEVCFELEQQHLLEATAFYRHEAAVVIPRLLPDYCSSKITAMTRIDGGKVTETTCSGVDNHRFAQILVEAMIAKPFWSRDESSLFHADPHAGNLFCTSDQRLAILDWTLVGRLKKSQRVDLMQIVLGGLSHDQRRICLALQGLGRTRPSEVPLQDAVAKALKELRQGQFPGFGWSQRLMDDIAANNIMGFPENLMLFRKALLTLVSVVSDIADTASIDQILLNAGGDRFLRESPERMLAAPGSREFATHVSNLDLVGLWATSPYAATDYWLGVWRDYLERFGGVSGNSG